MDTSELQSWIGRTEVQIDTVQPGPARALAATLDQDPDDFGVRAELPPLWMWLYFLPVVRASSVGPDGHPQRGGFLPPITLPRRMWAGSRCHFFGPVRIGDELTKVSTIAKVTAKTGRTGEMVFVTVRHSYSRGGAGLMEEEQDIVYMPIPDVFTPPEPVAPGACAWSESVAIDPVLLFRFSALTFNGHRIHYDRPYAMETEKYPGLVVHGPLQAILLMEAARRRHPGKRPAGYSFRGLRPIFDFDAVSVCGRMKEAGGLDLFTVNGDGAAGMQASLSWAQG
ncbi:MaoC family dehydratase N-terminal domain-containing protein [Hyphomonas sp.]|jgi:3-methylfumaryl-CoA hydratase|uniref:FAS1-like dehydratase domain-containing protein n=1 Tax=Hyphomonas sp. TaxID=87 RepID=UPI0025C3A3CA|nr:MaoC family dehydratase N-terminal domain-containing protein [Hyphomonas sp.]